MPMLPDVQLMNAICDECLKVFDEGIDVDVISLTDRLMSLECVPMHNPCHHVLTCAVLLTVASMKNGKTREELEKYLTVAKDRAGQVPGGFCGYNGCCGGAVSAGIFASIWLGSSPLDKKHWANCNKVTANALTNIANTNGPRCCKRSAYLSITATAKNSKELIGVDFGELKNHACSFSKANKDCIGINCPFFKD